MISLCSPALVYVAFSVTQIIIDFFKGHPNVALMKMIVTSIFTIMLEFLCRQGLTWMSWIIVFIPFILMTVIVSILLYSFGLDTATGTLRCASQDPPTKNAQKVVVYSPQSSSPAYQS